MNFRNADLLALAKQAPRCMSCGAYSDGTIVPAHANHIWKGMGMKAPDWAWAAMDFRCHALLDQGGSLSREDRRAMWLEAFYRTLDWLWTSGLIRIAADPVEYVQPPKKPSKKIRSAKAIPSRGFPEPTVKVVWGKGQKLASRPLSNRRASA